MGKIYVRVDDRLIHGQIIVAWNKFLELSEIVCIDDKTANNSILKQITTSSVPSGYKCSVLTLAQAKDKLKQPTEGNRLIIVRFIPNLLDILDEIGNAEYVIVGNLGKTPTSHVRVNSSIFISEADAIALNKIADRGLKIVFKTLPNTNEVLWSSLKDSFK